MRYTIIVEPIKQKVSKEEMERLRQRFEEVAPGNVALDENSLSLIANVDIESGSTPAKLLLRLDSEMIVARSHFSTELTKDERDPSD